MPKLPVVFRSLALRNRAAFRTASPPLLQILEWAGMRALRILKPPGCRATQVG
jgi:hypothetical protein